MINIHLYNNNINYHYVNFIYNNLILITFNINNIILITFYYNNLILITLLIININILLIINKIRVSVINIKLL
jgi:hypothetical protein